MQNAGCRPVKLSRHKTIENAHLFQHIVDHSAAQRKIGEDPCCVGHGRVRVRVRMRAVWQESETRSSNHGVGCSVVYSTVYISRARVRGCVGSTGLQARKTKRGSWIEAGDAPATAHSIQRTEDEKKACKAKAGAGEW